MRFAPRVEILMTAILGNQRYHNAQD